MNRFCETPKIVAGLLLAVAVAWIVSGPLDSRALAQGRAGAPFPRRVRAPALPEGLDWLNTDAPLELSDLRGKFVILDFWTYCCINCMHVLPELEKLEEAYPNNLVVIGVHTAKFQTEKDTENIREAILRYGIGHPVINDADHRVWTRFGVDSWPTLWLIDPEGYAVGRHAGETTFEKLDATLKKALPYYRKAGLLDETPLRLRLESARARPSPLRFPGKVLADEATGRLFVADSGHHRVVAARLDGTLVDTIGSGKAGAADGGFGTARFDDPQGMALAGETLYVADTRNHAIRRVDLAGQTVTTVAGTGGQNREPPSARMSRPKTRALASPWALLLQDDWLYVAMAGRHQIWRMDLDESAIGPYAGNGREDIVDGPRLPDRAYQTGFASFAQPSGLASDGTWLYVADSEGSSIRAVPLDPRQEVRTLVGTAGLPRGRLFTFGDADGPRDRVLLQHPLGVVYYQDQLYVADTYNNKIKRIDPESGRTETIAGTGEPGAADDPAQFDEPAGISAAGGKLYVADTNNHRIRVIDLAGGNRVSTLEIAGLDPPESAGPTKGPSPFADAERHDVEPVTVAPKDGKIAIQVSLQLPFGWEINALAPMAYQVDVSGRGPLKPRPAAELVRLEKPAVRFEVLVPVDAAAGRDEVTVGVVYYYCREGDQGMCKTGSVVWKVPVEVSAEADGGTISLSHRAK